jgi:hypothetical protein
MAHSLDNEVDKLKSFLTLALKDAFPRCTVVTTKLPNASLGRPHLWTFHLFVCETARFEFVANQTEKLMKKLREKGRDKTTCVVIHGFDWLCEDQIAAEVVDGDGREYAQPPPVTSRNQARLAKH